MLTLLSLVHLVSLVSCFSINDSFILFFMLFLIFFMFLAMVLIGFKYLASSLPIMCLSGVAVGVGLIFAALMLGISRNPSLMNTMVSWSFMGFSLVEVSGFIGIVFSFLLLYALTFFVDQSYFSENSLKDGNSSNWAVHYGPSMSALSLPSYCKIGHGMFVNYKLSF